MIVRNEPDTAVLREFLAAQAGASFSYPAVGATQGDFPRGFYRDERRWVVGHGPEEFAAACAALRRWEMIPAPWARVFPAEVPPAEGRAFAVVIRVAGVHWLNAVRVVYVAEESGPLRRFGFAYGTLEDHAERGEERFMVELAADGTVWYDVSAFSKPRAWQARLALPWVRLLQRRFAHESRRALVDAIAGSQA